jgi:hypothetical protein
VLAADERPLAWRKSNACFNGECVEVARCEDGVMVRNSVTPLATLCFTSASWRYFIVGLAASAGKETGGVLRLRRYDVVTEIATLSNAISCCWPESRINPAFWCKIRLEMFARPSRGDVGVDQGPQSMTAHMMRLIADDGHTRQHEKSEGSSTLLYSLFSGLVALSLGATASFAASSEESKLVVWFVVTAITAMVAGAAHESRWVRDLSRSVVHWIQSAQRL